MSLVDIANETPPSIPSPNKDALKGFDGTPPPHKKAKKKDDEDPGVKNQRILSVSSDEAILHSRQYVLEGAGFKVISALGFVDAAKMAEKGDYDLLLLGHTLSYDEKTRLIALAREHCDCAVLSIYKHGMPPHSDADFTVDSNDGPLVLLKAVLAALNP